MPSDKFLQRAKQVIKNNPEVFEALLEFEKTGRLPTIEELKKENKN